MSLAQVLAMGGFATFAVLLPDFQALWDLSATEAGWISAAYYVGYIAAVPVLVGVTDRIDSRAVYLLGALLASAGALGYAFLASGFWSASALRLVTGIGLAGTYMPGLKLVTDRLSGPRGLRAVPWYTGSFSLGASASYLLAGEAAAAYGWRGAFVVAGLSSLAAFALVLLAVRRRPAAARAGRRPLALGPVLRHAPVMRYILAYAGHGWELFAFRAWMVAFLVFSLERQPSDAWAGWSPGLIAALVVLLGIPASIAGAELAVRGARTRVIARIMMASIAFALVVGFLAAAPFPLVVALVFAYNALIMADSGALTAGAVEHAAADARGATLAVHSLIGFSGAALGPLATGLVLDLAGGGTSLLAWGLGMATIGAGSALGLAALRGWPPRPVHS